jgi:hypothetical protein
MSSRSGLFFHSSDELRSIRRADATAMDIVYTSRRIGERPER